MGGLACALALSKKGFTNINVYEDASNLGFVGAGIQLAPNLVRILTRLNCWDSIEAEATDVVETSIRGTFTLAVLFCVLFSGAGFADWRLQMVRPTRNLLMSTCETSEKHTNIRTARVIGRPL